MLALHLFDADSKYPITGSDKTMLYYMIRSGTHGTIENAVKNKTSKLGGGIVGEIRYIHERLFLPIDVVKHSFPLAYKYKVLLPIYRVIHGLSKNKKKLKAEFAALMDKASLKHIKARKLYLGQIIIKSGMKPEQSRRVN